MKPHFNRRRIRVTGCVGIHAYKHVYVHTAVDLACCTSRDQQQVVVNPGKGSRIWFVVRHTNLLQVVSNHLATGPACQSDVKMGDAIQQ